LKMRLCWDANPIRGPRIYKRGSERPSKAGRASESESESEREGGRDKERERERERERQRERERKRERADEHSLLTDHLDHQQRDAAQCQAYIVALAARPPARARSGMHDGATIVC
jgi:hypothetical protein